MVYYDENLISPKPGGALKQNGGNAYVQAIRVPFSQPRKSLKGVQIP